ncbi:MAG: hypothetical protein KC516_01215 [Nanoarchaeota archaeon]|nr:hypothetical protein [Nanoarchaeota archaeon]
MNYNIHGKNIEITYPCGMYYSEMAFLGPIHYGLMNTDLVMDRINNFPKSKVISEVTKFKEKAELQSKLEETPKGLLDKAMIEGPIPKIEEIRHEIENTVRFCETILRIMN